VIQRSHYVEEGVGGERLIEARTFRHEAQTRLGLERLFDDVEAGDPCAS
jgi:hypothetical protein